MLSSNNIGLNLYKHISMGAGGDMSIEADLLCERIYMEHLLTLASIDSEEEGLVEGDTSDVIILDPLDGSDNFLSHIPYYGSSLALCDRFGNVKEAVVFNFCTGEAFAKIAPHSPTFKLRFIKIQDGNATNKINIGTLQEEVSNIYSTSDKAFAQYSPTILETCEGICDLENIKSVSKCGIFEKAYTNPHIAKLFYEHGLKFRSLGASALSLAYAHETKFMLFMGEIRKYDSVAGLFLCRDLPHLSDKNFTLISKDKHIFAIIAKFLEAYKG